MSFYQIFEAVVNKSQNNKCYEQKLWTEVVIKKIFDQKFWTKVLIPDCEQKLLTKTCEPRE